MAFSNIILHQHVQNYQERYSIFSSIIVKSTRFSRF